MFLLRAACSVHIINTFESIVQICTRKNMLKWVWFLDLCPGNRCSRYPVLIWSLLRVEVDLGVKDVGNLREGGSRQDMKLNCGRNQSKLRKSLQQKIRDMRQEPLRKREGT